MQNSNYQRSSEELPEHLAEVPDQPLWATESWVTRDGRSLDHLSRDSRLLLDERSPEALYRWQYVESALQALTSGRMSVLVHSQGADQNDLRNLSTRRYYAESLGLSVSDFHFPSGSGTAIANVQSYLPQDLAEALVDTTEQASKDRFYAAALFHQGHAGGEPADFHRLFRDTVKQATGRGRLQIRSMGMPNEEVLQIASLQRRIAVISGCTVEPYHREIGDLGQTTYVASVTDVPAELRFAG